MTDIKLIEMNTPSLSYPSRMYDLLLERLIYRNTEKQNNSCGIYSVRVCLLLPFTLEEKTQHCTFLMQPSDCFEQPVWGKLTFLIYSLKQKKVERSIEMDDQLKCSL